MNNLCSNTRLRFIFFALLFLISSLILANAQVTLGTDSFMLTKSVYGNGDIIEGYTEMNLSSQSAKSILKLSFTNYEMNISLLDFLNNSGLKPGKDFFCNPKSCEETYQTVGTSTKTKQIAGGSKIIGAMITGKNIEFKSDVLEFEAEGRNSTQLCGISPLNIDVLNDKIIDWQYIEGGDFCGAALPSACYEDDNASKNFDVTTTGYCQKIFLPTSNKFKLIALVKRNKGGGDLILSLYDKKTGRSEMCNPEEPNEESSYIEKNCIVEFPVSLYSEDQEFYICIRDDLVDNGYSIKGEATQPVCGTVGLPNGNATADFALLVQPTYILPFNKTITFNDTEFSKINKKNLKDYLQDYVDSKYGGDCIPECLIPIKISAEQEVTIKNFAISYCLQGLCETESSFFELAKKPALINMNMTRLPLEPANFTAQGTGNHTVTFSIDDLKIGTGEILIEKIPIVREISQIGYEAMASIQFIVDAYSPKNNTLVEYQWDFGDGSTEQSTGNKKNHVYNSIGAFKIKVSVKDSQGLIGTKTKSINIGSPKEILNKTIALKKAILSNITTQIGSAGWYKEILEKGIKTTEINDKLSEYERQYKLATTDAEYLNIMIKLKELNMPTSLEEVESIQGLPLIVDVYSIIPEYISQIGGGSYDTNYAAETRNAIGDWGYKNLQILVDSQVIGITNEDNSHEDVATVINIKIMPDEQASELFFVIVLPFEKVKFASEYGQQKLDGAIGFAFKDTSEKTLNFAVPGRVDTENLIAFGSPYLGDLQILPVNIVCNDNGKCEEGENWKNCRSDCKPMGLAIFYILGIIALMFLAYILLQKWYKTKYEGFLFKNKQDLTNLFFFVGNSLKKGKQEKEISLELKKAGWSGEQIDYAIGKVTGKKIGLPEIRIKLKDIKIRRNLPQIPKT